MDLTDILSDEDQKRLADCLAAVVSHRYGEVRIIVQAGQVRYIEEKKRFVTSRRPPAGLSIPQE